MTELIDRSVFLKATRCRKAAWMSMHSPEFRDHSPLTAYHYNLQDLKLALRELFGKGVHCSAENERAPERIRNTMNALEHGEKVMYDPAIESEGMYATADVMLIGQEECTVVFARAARGIKRRSYLSAAFMLEVFQSRFPTVRIQLAHLNGNKRKSEQQPQSDFITLTDITTQAQDFRPEAKSYINDLKQLKASSDNPSVPIGPQCKSPYPCPFIDHCWGRLQHPESVLHLTGQQGLEWELLREGYEEMTEVPDRLLKTSAQQAQVDAWRTREALANTKELRKWYAQVKWPLALLDFETFGPVFPVHENMAPLQQLPFQFSVRRQKAPDEPFEVFHFLAKARDDYMEELTKALSESLDGAASILAYGAANERMVMEEIARLVPDHKASMTEAMKKLIDIQEPFRKQWLYKDRMNGTSSLKKVIPAFSPENSYDQLEVSNGYEAATAFEEMLRTEDPALKNKFREDLQTYCHRDTFALARLLDVIRDFSDSKEM